MPKPAPARLRALDRARRYVGVRERPPGSNSGPFIDGWLRGAGARPGQPWCMAFVHAMYDAEGVTLGGWAGVGNFRGWAYEHGYLLVPPHERPLRGDLVCYEWNGDDWPDHIGFVEKVLAVRWKGKQFVGWVRTIEGNTSSGAAGSQDDGGGVYRRRRWMKPEYQFVRVTG